MRTIVIGGGISGLACAYRLQKSGVQVTLIEQSDRAGGVIASIRLQGFLFDLGPQSFLLTEALAQLVSELGLESELLRANPRAPRFVLWQGRLERVPMGPHELFTTRLLSLRSKLSLVCEPVRRTAPPEEDESVAQFVRRKFGEGVLERLAGPFVSGVYAGDPERLSLRSAFPSLYEWEKKFGSVLRGVMKSLPREKARPTLCSFRGGTAVLPDAMAQGLGSAIQLGVAARSLSCKPGAAPCFEVAADRGGQVERFQADSVILATPAQVTAGLLGSLSARLAELLGSVEYAPVTVVNSGYRREQVRHDLAGFGFLIPREEGLNTLGTVWNSSLLTGRAPEGLVSLTSFVGRITNQQVVSLEESDIAATVERELSRVLGISGPPVVSHVRRIERAIPQYNLGHGSIIAAIRAELHRIPGLFVTGNYFEGPSIGTCLEQANAATSDVLKFAASGSCVTTP